MDIKIGSLTNAFMFDPLEVALRNLSQIGFRYVEIMCDRPHMYPGDYSKEERQRVKALCDELKLEIVALDAIHVSYGSMGITQPTGPYTGRLFYPNPNGTEAMFTCLDPKMRQARIDYIKQCIDMAVDLNCPKVETYSGKLVTDPDNAYRLSLEGIRECTAYAAEKKVTLLVEMAEELIFGTPDEVIELIEEIQSPWLKVGVDIGHLEVESRNINDTIRKLRKYVGNFHVDDIRRHKHYHMAIGRGEINWDSCFKTIQSIGYTDSVCLEIYPYALDPVPAVTESFQYLMNCVEKI